MEKKSGGTYAPNNSKRYEGLSVSGLKTRTSAGEGPKEKSFSTDGKQKKS